jgi:DNA helicase-2/ATP-dependent DNA helicase PcrA
LVPEFDTIIGAAGVRSDTPGTPLIRVPVENLGGALLELWKIQSASAKTPDEFQKLKSDFLSQVDRGFASLRETISADQFRIPEPPWRYKVDRISQSNIEDYRACPLRFYFGKVLNLPSPSNPNMILGSVVHSVLEEAGRALSEKRVTPLDELIATFEKRWSSVSLDDPDRKERLRQRGHDILERFVRVQAQKPGYPLELEKSFSIPLQDAEGNEVANLVGRIDRIDAVPDGLEIIDYKTGKQPKNSKNDLQLPIYSLACSQLYGKYPSAVTFLYLGDDDPLVSETCDPARLDEIKSEIMEIIDEINSSEFVATPGFVCNGCSFARICPARQE